MHWPLSVQYCLYKMHMHKHWKRFPFSVKSPGKTNQNQKCFILQILPAVIPALTFLNMIFFFFSKAEWGKSYSRLYAEGNQGIYTFVYFPHMQTHTHKHATGDNKDVESDKVVKETSGPHCTCQSHTPAVKINNFIYKEKGRRGLLNV